MKTPLLLLSIALLSACATRPIIKGRINGLTNDTVIVQSCRIADMCVASQDIDRYVRKDTLATRNGKLAIHRRIDQPTLFMIRPSQAYIKIPGGHQSFGFVSDVIFFLGNKERVSFQATADSIFIDYTLSGSKLNTKWSSYRAAQQPDNRRQMLLQPRLRTPGPEADAAREESRRLLKKSATTASKYIRENPGDLLSAYLLPNVSDSVKIYSNKFDKEVRNSMFKPMIDDILKQAEAKELRQEAQAQTNSGSQAPNFTLKTPDGSDFTLSSLRGKYVVLDFWGSWCIWCIKGMPEMKATYEKYKDKLEIVGVACNDKPEKWHKAIEEHAVPWINVINPRGAEPTEDVAVRYSIQGFPTKIIIDPEGCIVKKFVGETSEFYKKLDELLK